MSTYLRTDHIEIYKQKMITEDEEVNSVVPVLVDRTYGTVHCTGNTNDEETQNHP